MINNNIIIQASKYYQKQFAENKDCEIAKYIINNRKFSNETLNIFGIGISTDSKGLIDYLLSLGYTYGEMLSNGLVNKINGVYVDFFTERFIIEIRGIYGDLVAFGGRQLSGNKRYKYLNTKTTPLFTKKKTVFNLDKAKDYIDYINNPYLILVEGYCDVMSLWQNGIKNVVCTMGTACSDEQAKLIKMFCNKVVICYDGDTAGQNATDRADLIFKNNNIKTYKLCLPNCKDPDDILGMDNGKQIFLDMVKNCMV